MAISQRGSATTGTTTTGTGVSANKPSGVVSGDVLVATFVCNNQDAQPPSGWTQFVDEVIDVFRLQCYYKVAGGSEPSSYQWEVDSDAPLVLTITAWEGVDGTSVLDIDAATETDTSHSEPYTTPQLSGAGATSGRVMYVRAVRESGSNPATFTEGSATASELADVGVFSGGSVSYSIGVFADTADYSGTANKPGLAVTCNLSEEHNIVATWALKSSGIPGTMDVLIPLAVVAMDGTVSVDGVLDVEMPLIQMTSEGLATDTAGTLDTTIILPVVDIAGSLEPVGTLDAVIDIGMDVEVETRYFGDNVVVIPPDIRVVQVVDGEQTPSLIYDKHPGHLIRQPFAGEVNVMVTAFNTAFDYAPAELAAPVAVTAFQASVFAGNHADPPAVAVSVVANNASVRIQPMPPTVTVDVS